jgi:hypothetical protein
MFSGRRRTMVEEIPCPLMLHQIDEIAERECCLLASGRQETKAKASPIVGKLKYKQLSEIFAKVNRGLCARRGCDRVEIPGVGLQIRLPPDYWVANQVA